MAGIVLAPLHPSEALEFFRAKGVAPPFERFSYLDLFREEHARTFTVAKAMRDDVLQALRQAVDDALAGGLTLEQFSAALEPELKRLGWWGEGMELDPKTGAFETVQLGSRRRLSIIYDANLRSAYSAGHWTRIQRNKRAFPYLRYRQIDRDSKREAHKPYDGLVLPVDHPAWRKIFPPNGWRCGCWVEPLTEGQMRRRGYRVDEDFALEEAPYTNRRTGETVMVPKGVDPSWSSNPGIDREISAAE